MKKKYLKKKLKIATKALETYQGYAINGIKYADSALYDIDLINKTYAKENDWDDPITDYWLKYYIDENSSCCSLCGQSGIIHTEGIRTPAGVEVGTVNYCICPNGQARRADNGN